MSGTFLHDGAVSQTAPNSFDISERLFSFVKTAEGFRPVAELDTLAAHPVWTIGYGDTWDVREGDTITEPVASEELRKRLEFYSRSVCSMVKVPITQGQHDALVDFAYNLGCEHLRWSTLLRLLNAGLYHSAVTQFDRWIWANGKKLPGLVSRRATEREWFSELPSVTPEVINA